MKSFISLLLLVPLLLVSACASSNMMASSALRNGEINLSDYKYAAIYDSETASFMELELENLMEQNGLKVIGESSAKKYKKGSVLGVKYVEDQVKNGYGNAVGTTFTISLEDFTTDKTLLTINGQETYMGRDAAWKEVSKQLNSALSTH